MKFQVDDGGIIVAGILAMLTFESIKLQPVGAAVRKGACEKTKRAEHKQPVLFGSNITKLKGVWERAQGQSYGSHGQS